MKTFSKILSIALVLSMVLGFALVGTAAETTLATFTFPANATNSSIWQDGTEFATKSFTDGSYTLTFTNGSKVYANGNDGAGRGFIKFGTSSNVGTMTFTVPSDVTRVELQLAGYKAKTSKYSINGGSAVTLTKQASQDATASQYDVVSVDTSSQKTVTVASVSGATRMVLFAVTYYGGGTVTVCDHNESKLSWDHDDTQHWKVCSCGAYSTAKENHDGNATCVCGYSAPAYVAIADGQYTIFAANKYLASLGATSNYGYPPASDTATSNCVYTVENASNNQFYLKDANGRYIYNTGTYKNVNASATKPTSGGLWAVLQSGSTQLLISIETNKAMQFGTSYGTFQFVDDHSTADAVTFATYTPPACVHVDADSDYLCDNGCGEILAPAADSELTVEQVIALGQAHAHNVYTNNKYYVTGTITEVYSTQYGNMYITDGNGNTLTVYGTYNYDGSTRYDSMTSKPGVGDEVTLYGVIGQYDGTSQMKNAWIDDFVVHTCVDDVADHKCDICDETISECEDADKDHACDICDETISECDDADKDHACDTCEAEMGDHTVDADGDHKCDYCDATISGCEFNSADFITTKDGHSQSCTCGEVGEEEPHADADGDYICDVCEYELDVPKTGDISLIPVVIMAVLSATGSALVFKKKYF